jgi:hypothetical protein
MSLFSDDPGLKVLLLKHNNSKREESWIIVGCNLLHNVFSVSYERELIQSVVCDRATWYDCIGSDDGMEITI